MRGYLLAFVFAAVLANAVGLETFTATLGTPAETFNAELEGGDGDAAMGTVPAETVTEDMPPPGTPEEAPEAGPSMSAKPHNGAHSETKLFKKLAYEIGEKSVLGFEKPKRFKSKKQWDKAIRKGKFKGLDMNGDKKVTEEEVMAGIVPLPVDKEVNSEFLKDLTHVRDEYIKDSENLKIWDETIRRESFGVDPDKGTAMERAVQPQLSEWFQHSGFVRAFVKLFDTNNDGVISKKEFIVPKEEIYKRHEF